MTNREKITIAAQHYGVDSIASHARVAYIDVLSASQGLTIDPDIYARIMSSAEQAIETTPELIKRSKK